MNTLFCSTFLFQFFKKEQWNIDENVDCWLSNLGSSPRFFIDFHFHDNFFCPLFTCFFFLYSFVFILPPCSKSLFFFHSIFFSSFICINQFQLLKRLSFLCVSIKLKHVCEIKKGIIISRKISQY